MFQFLRLSSKFLAVFRLYRLTPLRPSEYTKKSLLKSCHPKQYLLNFNFLPKKIPQSKTVQKILRSSLKFGVPPPPSRAPLVLPNEIFSYLLHIFTRSILCVGKCTKLSKDLNTEFSSTGHIVPSKGMQHDA